MNLTGALSLLYLSLIREAVVSNPIYHYCLRMKTIKRCETYCIQVVLIVSIYCDYERLKEILQGDLFSMILATMDVKIWLRYNDDQEGTGNVCRK